jgi:iron(II)-dependent oxidoreductase
VLENADLDSEDPFLKDGYAWEFAIQHEYQHHETIAEMLQLIQKRRPVGVGVGGDQPWTRGVKSEFVDVPAGQFLMGTNVASAYDNEKVARTVDVEKFRLSRTAVTAREWTIFIEDGGYARRELWSEDGWSWKESECAVAPEYWLSRENRWLYFGPRGLRAIHPDEPASCLSWHEANAYANWAGKRLPTEIEWEYAASLGEDPGLAGNPGACHGLTNWGPRPVGLGKPSAIGIFDMAGNVWEWTSSPFLPYPGFVAFPYDGYSKDHMLGAHRVCRGGSWATSAPILRRTFRNWYVPTYRQGFLGVRLAE